MSEDGVTYSFKDLFDKFDQNLSDGFKRLDGRLDEINRKIDQKADNTRVAALEEKHAQFEVKIEERFVGVDNRFRPLELAEAGVSAVSKYKWAFWTAVFIAIGSLASLVYALGGIR